MDDSGDILPFHTLAAARQKPAAAPAGEPLGETVAPGQAFATATGGRVAESLEFIRRDGSSFSVPYNYAPLLWWHPPGSLTLEYPGFFSVEVRGSHLTELHRRLRDRKVTWICETGELGAAGVAAVTTLEIVNSFPSREHGAAPEPK